MNAYLVFLFALPIAGLLYAAILIRNIPAPPHLGAPRRMIGRHR